MFSDDGGPCVSCEGGSYSEAAAGGCTQCVDGQYAAAGAPECLECEEGQTSVAGASECYDTPEVTSVRIAINGVYQVFEDDIIMICTLEANYKPDVVWLGNTRGGHFRDPDQVVTDLGDGVYQTEYTISNPGGDDSGAYTCSAENGRVEHTVRYVFFEPRTRTETYYIKANSDFTITCNSLAYFETTLLVDGEPYVSSESQEESDEPPMWSQEPHTVTDITENTVIQCTSTVTDGDKTITASTVTVNIYLWAYTNEESFYTISGGEVLTVTCYKPITDGVSRMFLLKDGFSLPGFAYTTEVTSSVTINEMEYSIIEWSLLILTSGNGGVYSCSSKINNKVITLNTVTIVIGEVSMEGGGVVESRDISITCSITGVDEAVVSWTQDNEEVPLSAYSQNADGADVLSVSGISDDVINFVCTYDDEEALSASTDVVYADFVAPEEKIENTSGEVTVTCKYKSTATFTVVWKKLMAGAGPGSDPVILTSVDEDVEISSVVDISGYTVDTLTLSNVDTYELITVSCVYSSVSYDWENVMSSEIWKRGFVSTPPEFTYVGTGSYNLECQFASSYLPLSPSWTKNGESVSSATNVMLSSNTMSSTLSITITPDTASDEYECTFTDSEGVEMSATTTVALVEVEIMGKDGVNNIYPSTTQPDITCEIRTDSVDVSKIHWLRDEVELSDGSDYGIVSNAGLGTSVLTFNDLTMALDDQYICKYEIGSDDVSDDANVYIYLLTIDDSSEEYLESFAAISLTCTYLAAVEQPVTWLMNGIGVSNFAEYGHTVEQTAVSGGYESVLVVDIASFVNSPISDTVYRYWCEVDTNTAGILTLSSERKIYNLRLAVGRPNTVVETATDWTITCILMSDSAASFVSWYKGADLLDTEVSEDPSYRTSQSNDEYILEATGTSSSDSAVYTCRFTFASGDSVEGTIDVTVRTMTLVNPVNEILAPGDSIDIECSITTSEVPTRIDWYKAETLLLPSQSEYTVTGNIYLSVLSIVTASLSDAGVYHCVGVFDDDVNPTVDVSLIIAELTPTVVDVELTLGGSVTLTCNYIGSAQPINVYWKKDGQVANPGGGYISQVGEYESNTMTMRLTINYVESSHSGQITCAVDIVGLNEDVVVVTGNPIQISLSSAIILSPAINFFYNTGADEDVTLGCELTSSNEPPWTKWYKDNEEITASEGVLTIVTSLFVSNQLTTHLTIHNPMASDSGDYHCAFGATTTSATPMELVVREVTSSVSGLGDYLTADSMKLTCTVKAQDKCSIIWYRGDSVFRDCISNKEANEVEGVWTVSKVNIIPFNPGQYDGLYHCEVSCPYGPGYETSHYDVVQQYVWTEGFSYTEVILRTHVIIRSCNYRGDEIPVSGNWYIGGELVVADSQYLVNFRSRRANAAKTELTVHNPTEDDDGTYVCKFELSSGEFLELETQPVRVIMLSGMSYCTVAYEQTVDLECLYRGSQDYDSVAWYHFYTNTNNYEVVYDEVTSITEGVFSDNERLSVATITLPISLPSVFACFVDIEPYTAHIATYLTPGTMLVSTDSATSVYSRAVVTLTCNIAENMYDVTWFKGGDTQITKSNGAKKFTFQNTVLEYRVTEDVVITCSAKAFTVCGDIDTVTSSNSVSFSLLDITYLTHPQNMDIKADKSKIELTCSLPYNPDIKIRWMSEDSHAGYGSKELNDDNTIITSTLKIKTKKAEPSYYCIASTDNWSTQTSSDTAYISRVEFTLQPVDVHSVDNAWVAFKCSVEAASQIPLILVTRGDDTLTSVGTVSMAYPTSGDVVTSTATITIDPTTGMENTYRCLAQVDNGYILSHHADLVNTAIEAHPSDQWAVVGRRVTFACMTTSNTDLVIWEHSDDAGSTWETMSSTAVATFSDEFIIHRLTISDVALSDVGDYRAKIEADPSEYTAGGVEYSDVAQLKLRTIMELTYSTPAVTGGELITVNDDVIFTCTIVSDIKPSSIKWKYSADSQSYRKRGAVETGALDTYTGTTTKRASRVIGKELTCEASFGRTYNKMYKSYTFSPTLGCEQLDARPNSLLEYYETGGVSYVSVTCVGADAQFADASDTVATCDSSTGEWSSTLTSCRIEVAPPPIAMAFSWNFEYCVTPEEVTYVLSLANGENEEYCGYRSTAISISCLYDGNCAFDPSLTTCSLVNGKMRLTGYYTFTGASSDFRTTKAAIDSRKSQFSLTCTAPDRKRRSLSDDMTLEELLAMKPEK